MKLQVPRGLFVYFAAVAVNLLSYGGGLGYGWSSPALPKLTSHVDNPLKTPATLQQESWIASLLSLGAMISPFISEFLSEKIGRKRTLLIFALPMLCGNVIMVFANRVVHFYLARFLIGLSEGSLFSTIPVYSSEIAEDHNRGTIGAIMLLFVSLGHFTSSVVGPYVTIPVFSLVTLLPPILFLCIFGIFVPESPYFYILVNKEDMARDSLKLLRGTEDVEQEVQAMIQGVKTLKKVKGNVLKELFLVRQSLKAFFLALGLMMLQQFTGLIYIVDYTQKIFDSSLHNVLTGEVSVILVMTVQLVSIAISTQLIDRINRRTLLFTSLTLILLIHLSMGTLFLLQPRYNLNFLSWLPILCLMMFILAFQLGIGPISYIFPGEIMEPNVKSLGNTFVISIGLMGEFGIATLFPLMADQMGFHTPFWIFAGMALAALWFVWACVPETRCRSFMEIQEDVRNNKL